MIQINCVQVKTSGITFAWWYYRIHYIYIAMRYPIQYFNKNKFSNFKTGFIAKMTTKATQNNA